MDATIEYPAWESFGIASALIYRDSGIPAEYRGFLAIVLALRILIAVSDFCELSGSDGALLVVPRGLMHEVQCSVLTAN